MSNMLSLEILNNSLEDYKLLEKWYQEEIIYRNFEQRKLSFNEIKNKYYQRTKKGTQIPVYMIKYNNKKIGIIQYQLISEKNKKLYDIRENMCYEIDIFIGELEFHNKGIGRETINLMVNQLFKEKRADLLVMCPLRANIIAMKCYENCGFKTKKYLKMPDTIGKMQEYALMIKTRE